MAAATAKEEKVDLVVMGKLAIDGDYGQTAQMTAAQLGWSAATNLYSVRFFLIETKKLVCLFYKLFRYLKNQSKRLNFSWSIRVTPPL